MQNEDTQTAMAFAGLSAYETWMHYCNMGGFTDYFEFDAYLGGLYGLDAGDADLVSQAVNELIDDACTGEEARLCRAPYSWTPRADAGPAGILHRDDVDGFEDAIPFRIEADDLVGPHSAETFGSRFLAGRGAGAPTGRPGIPLPPGAPAELLGDVLDSRVIGRAVSAKRK